ncbi:MAG: twin-arginine translocase TatA/TatE family subunit [Planctomycetes bacterium]|nr:twin-arginine translocase TatA/TatE family subunit [Planctomycetota bacterium]
MVSHPRLVPLLLCIPSCGMPHGAEWMWIALIALLLFGSAKLPGMMRSMGSGINEFKRGLKDGEGDEVKEGEQTSDSDSDPKGE